MSAALQLPAVWGTAGAETVWIQINQRPKLKPRSVGPAPASEPNTRLAFYRKHTEKMLRRYLYASMQVGRAPEILAENIGKGWVSSRPIASFEDAVIFVLDVEKCLDKLDSLERQLLSRIVLQDYTQTETADILGMAVRTVIYKFPRALDRLTQLLLDAGLLLP
jgi:DNA-directed RNA polymerase specialized sigma24 family protein